MFERLSHQIDTLDIPSEPGAVAELHALHDRLTARLAEADGALEADGTWAADGSVSYAGWLRRNCGQDSTTANRTSRRARKVHRLVPLRAAWVDGRLSGAQVDAVLANVPFEHLDRFLDDADALIDTIGGLDADLTARVMQHWKIRADTAAGKDHTDPDPDPVDPPSTLHLSELLAGRGVLDADLRAALLAKLQAALQLADSGDLDTIPAERRADALEVILDSFLDHQTVRKGGRHRPHINVVLDPRDRCCQVVGGGWLDTTETSMLLCDSVLHRLQVGASGILDYGRATRTVPVDLWNALVLCDRGCRFLGCNRPARWTDGHHIWHWEHGGPTSLDNLVLVCRRHHRTVHSKGWSAKLLPDATLEITNPAGLTATTRPPGPAP